jgi:hypothetical protein
MFYALLDTGCDTVIFPSDIAELVDVSITAGKNFPTVGVSNTPVDVYYHMLTLMIPGDGRRLPTLVGFSEGVPCPLLGRMFFAHYTSIIFREAAFEVEFQHSA